MKASKVWFSIALWAIEQSSTLSAKFDCPVACQNISLLDDCETGLLLCKGMLCAAIVCPTSTLYVSSLCFVLWSVKARRCFHLSMPDVTSVCVDCVCLLPGRAMLRRPSCCWTEVQRSTNPQAATMTLPWRWLAGKVCTFQIQHKWNKVKMREILFESKIFLHVILVWATFKLTDCTQD